MARSRSAGEGAPPKLAKTLPEAYRRPMEADSPNTPIRSLTETIFVLFLRVVALACLWFGLQYWALIVGYSHDGMGRFDLLSTPWRFAATGLAVVFPVAALGLWVAGSWGPVMWLMAAGGQMLMFTVWPEIFGRNMLAVTMHSAVFVVFILFRLALWLEGRHKQERITVDLP